MFRGVLLIVAVVGAVAIPYFSASSENREKFTGWVQSLRGNSEDDGDWMASIYGDLQSTRSTTLPPHLRLGDDGNGPSAAGRSGRPTHETPVLPLERLLRFDVTPAWVIDTWPRVTTRLYEGPLEGLRVPIITGTEVHDLVGSLTYYFDKRLRLQRIVLHGQTGDGRRIVSFVTRYYGLQSEPTLGGWLFTGRWNGQPTSVLRVQHAPLVKADKQRQRVQVDLELNLPGAPCGVSSRLEELIGQEDKQGDKHSDKQRHRITAVPP